MGLMATMVVLSVLLRYVFNLTYTWSEELIIYLFVATTYFGSIICVKEKEHIDIPFLRQIVPDGAGAAMDIVVCIANIIVQIGLAYFSFTWMEKAGSSLSSGMYIPLYIIYSMFPICFVLMAIYTFRRLETDIRVGIMNTRETDAGKLITHIVFLVIYLASLAGIIRLYFTIDWLGKVATSHFPKMMTQIWIVFTVILAACCALLLIYAIKRVQAMIKGETMQGGEQ